MRLSLLCSLALAPCAVTPPAAAEATPYCVAVPNSTGVGATIRWQGPLLPAQGGLVVRDLPQRSFGIFIYGLAQNRTPFGNGVNCIGGAPWILARKAPTNGVVTLDLASEGEPEDLDWIGSQMQLHWYFQYMYRDPLAGGAGFNLSDAIDVQFAFAGL